MAENRKLTFRQKAFVDFYIKTGNATESAIKAGYSDKTARAIGYENLTKPHIRKCIARRQQKIDSKRIADGDEVLAVLTSFLRDENEETKDRIRSADLLGKRWQLWTPATEEQSNMTDRLIEHMEDIKTAMISSNEPHALRHPDLEDDADD